MKYQGQKAQEMVNDILTIFKINDNELDFVKDLLKDDRYSHFDAEILYNLLIATKPLPIESAPKLESNFELKCIISKLV